MQIMKRKNYSTRLDFIKDVRKEIHALRKHLTKDQKAKLNFENFYQGSLSNCIYGQAYGYTLGTSAMDFKSKHSVLVSIINYQNPGSNFSLLENYFSNMRRELSIIGSSYSKTKIQIDSINKMIIKFIKGDIKELRKLS